MVDYTPSGGNFDDYYYEMERSGLLKDTSDPFHSLINSESENSGFSMPQSKNYWAVILGLLCIIVVIGNVLVIVSVFKEKVLQNVTNYFIVSLAVADLMVAGCVMPFSVYVLVSIHFITFSMRRLKLKA